MNAPILSGTDSRTVRRILKVNHAGEYGAVRIYRAQLALARLFYPDLVPFLDETLGHEIVHCKRFREAMPPHDARPCRIMALWGNGGYLLGLLTGLTGRQGIWVCTAAVEETVHRHLDEQIRFLAGCDDSLRELISDIQVEELAHLRQAEEQIVPRWPLRLVLDRTIRLATEIVIWLSTWGDSARMARDLAARHPNISASPARNP